MNFTSICLAPDCGKLADAGPKAALCAGNLEQGEYRDADHGRKGYAPSNCVRPVRIVVLIVLVPLIVLDREVQDQLKIIFYGET